MNINGQKVRELRRAAGIRQEDLAERVGVSQAMVSQIEQGCRACRSDTTDAIAAELGCTFEDIAGEPSYWIQFMRNCKRLSEAQLLALNQVAIQLASTDSPPKSKELAATDSQHTHYANLLEKADSVVEVWRDKCQCDCPAEVFIPMEELSSAIIAANQHNA